MKDALEQHILKHKAELDVFEPGDRIWEAIDQDLHGSVQPLRERYSWVWKVAAAVLLLLVIGLGLRQFLPENEQLAQGGEPQPVEDARSHYSPELIEVETYYHQVIDTKMDEIRRFQDAGITIEDSPFGSLEELQHMYKELQGELLQGANQELVVNAMVQNLTMQMEILNQQLSILEQIKSMQDDKPQSL